MNFSIHLGDIIGQGMSKSEQTNQGQPKLPKKREAGQAKTPGLGLSMNNNTVYPHHLSWCSESPFSTRSYQFRFITRSDLITSGSKIETLHNGIPLPATRTSPA